MKIGDMMRLLCCLLLVWSVLLSGCGDPKEEAAVAAIKKLGGKVRIEGFPFGDPSVTVDLSGQPVTDGDMVHLKGLTGLKTL